ncbi:hypothetical protein EB821_05765 [Candidatus Marinimicrobia bacterium PRS2]|nr:hypothetical protein EB821_05765 [Candidatus Marinimicrobia bacterium PRS2]
MLLISACTLDNINDPQFPYWTTRLDIPLTSKTITFADILPDSLVKIIPLDANGEAILYAFQDTIPMDTITFDMQIGISPFSEGISSKLGPIELADIPETSTPRFEFIDIFPEAADLDQSIVPISPFTLPTIINDFTFEDFEQAEFNSGALTLTIDNQLPINLDDITVSLIRKSDDELIKNVVFENSVQPGQKQFEKMDLSSTTLYSEIIIQVDGRSDGGNNISIDLANNYFTVNIGADSLVVSSAIAKIPAQGDPITGEGLITLGSDSENKVQSAQFNNGHLQIDINNQVDLSATLSMKIPNIQNEGGMDSTWTIELPRNELTSTSIDLNGKFLVLDIEEQEVTYNYEITLENTDELRTVTELDRIDVHFSFYGKSSEDSTISFSQITGQIEDFEETIAPISQEMTALPEEMEGFNVIAYDNNMGDALEMAMELTMSSLGELSVLLNLEIEGKNEDDNMILYIENWDITDSSRIIIPHPDSLINMQPDSIVISGSALVTDQNKIITFNAVDEITMFGNFFISLPFVFKVSDSTSITIDPEHITGIDIPQEIESLTLFIDYHNQFDFGVDISVSTAADTNHFAENSSIKPDTLIHSLTLEPNKIARDSVLLDQSKFDLLADDFYLQTHIKIIGAETIFFLSTDSLQIKLSASVEYMINDPDEE